MTTGTAMSQTTARQLAQRVGGVATLAQPRRNGGFRIGGWRNKNSQWIVLLPGGAVMSTPDRITRTTVK